MHVADPRSPQLCRQGRPVELRVVSRSGDTAYVYDALDAVRPQKLEEVFPCACGMSNRQDNGHWVLAFLTIGSLFQPNHAAKDESKSGRHNHPIERAGGGLCHSSEAS